MMLWSHEYSFGMSFHSAWSAMMNFATTVKFSSFPR
jgi:hypothetical protein